jgi:uncharacterized protein YqfA (UPF0365 family)
MGQLIVVTEKPSSNPGVVRFETNRLITGMGHERYRAGDEIWGNRPPDVLARRLLAQGSVDGVHVNGNVVTVDLAKGRSAEGLKEIVEKLYLYYDEERTAEFLAAEAEKAKAAAEAAEAEARAKAEEEAKAKAEEAAEQPAAEEPAADAPAEQTAES